MNDKKLNVQIIYEDESLIIVNKPIGMLSHPDSHLKEMDLLTYFHKTRNDSSRYAVINRLDYNTFGLIIIGKNDIITKELNKASMEKSIRKSYLCAVSGYFFQPTDTLTAFLLKDSTQSKVRISNIEIKNSQKIMTRYTVLKEANNMSLLDIELLTGKTHQIRAHLAHVGHPIVGDPLYGFPSVNKKANLKTQALCAYKLLFHNINEGSPLYYLNNRTFQISSIPFMSLFSK